MKHRVTVTAVLLLSLAFLLAPSAAWAECMSIAVGGVVYDTPPAQIDFGDVTVGETGTLTLTITNVECGDGFEFAISVGSVTADPLPFSLDEDAAPPPEVVLAVGASMDIDLYFSPTEAGDFAATLTIESNAEPPYALATIGLMGSGVEAPADDAAAIMDELLETFEAYVDAGDIWGIGPGRSARNRLDAFRAHLLAADWLIDEGAGGWACIPLAAAYAKADGDRRPPDFVDGPGLDGPDGVLALIQGVMDALGCGEGHGGCHH